MVKQIIWSNTSFFDEEARQKWQSKVCEKDEPFDDEYWWEIVEADLADQKFNLDIEVEGVIMAFVDIGIQHRRSVGCHILGSNVKEIFSLRDDYSEWYADNLNIRADYLYRDGVTHALFRIADNHKVAERLSERIMKGILNEVGFRDRTRSLYPYVAKAYGWDKGLRKSKHQLKSSYDLYNP